MRLKHWRSTHLALVTFIYKGDAELKNFNVSGIGKVNKM